MGANVASLLQEREAAESPSEKHILAGNSEDSENSKFESGLSGCQGRWMGNYVIVSSLD